MSSIFVPFHDGLLDFDCRECSACCQAGNIVATGSEKDILIQENPCIRFFAADGQGNQFVFHKHPRCWFLESDGRCEIQRKHGYALKPFICRLHPFYVAKCLDENVVIPSGCDKLYVPPPGSPSHVAFDSVVANAREAIDCGHFFEEINWPAERLDLERDVLAESSNFLDHKNYLDFAACQLTASRPGGSRSDARDQLEKALHVWRLLLGIEELNIENQPVCRELVAITSLLRVACRSLRNMEPERIPAALLALFVYMILFSRGRDARRFVASYESVLADVPVGLAYVTEDDLRIRRQPLEKKLLYIRALKQMHTPGFLKFRGRKSEVGGQSTKIHPGKPVVRLAPIHRKKPIPSHEDLRKAMPRLRTGSQRLIREDRDENDTLRSSRFEFEKIRIFLKATGNGYKNSGIIGS